MASTRSITNYGRNLRFTPKRKLLPRTVTELQSIVRESKHVRAVGAAHSWSPAIVTDDTLVSLDRMTEPLSLGRNTVTVQGGMRLRDLNTYLDRHDLALTSLGSIDSQSVAGVVATGTHGSGKAFRCISSQVAKLQLIDGRGNDVTLERGHPDFDGAVVGLGALGIVHAITYDVVPAFRLHDVTGVQRFADAIDNIDELVAGGDHVKVWWLPPGDDAIVYRYDRTDAAATDSRMRRWFKERVFSVAVYRTLLAAGRLSGRRWIPAINRFLTREAGRPLDRIVPSQIGFLTPIPPIHAESEWAFDVRDARAILHDYRDLLASGGHTYNFIQEIRFSRADELWLSPAYHRDSMWLSLYNIDPVGWPEQLRRFEDFARAHGGRPHWGKQATFDRDYLRRQYPRLDDFAQLAARFDPDGKFRNAWLDDILGRT